MTTQITVEHYESNSFLVVNSQQNLVSGNHVTEFSVVPEAKLPVYEYIGNSNKQYSERCHMG